MVHYPIRDMSVGGWRLHRRSPVALAACVRSVQPAPLLVSRASPYYHEISLTERRIATGVRYQRQRFRVNNGI